MEVIEEFLLEQLNKAIETAKTSSSCLLSFNLHNDCQEIKYLIERKAPDTGAADDSIRKEKLYYLNNIMARWQMILSNHNQCTPQTLCLVNELSKSLTRIRTDLEAKPPASDHTTSSSSPEDETFRWSFSYVDPTKIYGIDDNTMIMERMLVRNKERNFKAIGIVGMAGVGKTALCQVVFNNDQVRAHFFPRVWVCLSKQPDCDQDYQKEVAKRILKSLGFGDEVVEKVGQGEGGLPRLLVAIRQQLRGKRYLIVLDDVWKWEDDKGLITKFCSSLGDDDKLLEDHPRLAYGLPKGDGGTVIVTSRYEMMAEKMVEEKNVHKVLPVVDEESCWKIFKDEVLRDGLEKLPEDVEKMENMIKEKSAGLPLAAKMMGRIVIADMIRRERIKLIKS